MNTHNQTKYTSLSDKQLQDLKTIDEDIKNGIKRKTVFPGHIYKASNGMWYEFFTNINSLHKKHVETVLANLSQPIDYIINDEAFDVYDNIVPYCCSVWVPVNTVPRDVLNEFFKLDYALSERYKTLLLQCDISIEELKDINSIYLGCEKDRWPDKPWITNKINELVSKKNS